MSLQQGESFFRIGHAPPAKKGADSQPQIEPPGHRRLALYIVGMSIGLLAIEIYFLIWCKHTDCPCM